MRTFYICDRERPRCKGKNCEDCHHTSDKKYAANGICEDPENHPERFELWYGDYWEKEKSDDAIQDI